MRTFLFVLFALAAVAMGGMWLLVQTEPGAGDDMAMTESAMPPPPAPEESSAVMAEESASAADEAFADADVGDEGFGDEAAAEEEERFSVAAARRAAPEPDPVVATQSIREQFESREVTYNRPPATLGLNHPIDVSLVINATGVEGAGAEALQGFDGEIVDRDVELTDVVSAQLTGPGFDIVEQTVERQRLSPRVLNRWQWRVTPTKEGTQTLVLEIFGYADGALEGEPLDAYRDEIVVEVENLDRVISFAREYEPVFAVGAGVAGGLSALFGFLRFRGERKRRKGS